MTDKLNEIKQTIDEIRERTVHGLPDKRIVQGREYTDVLRGHEVSIANEKLRVFFDEFESYKGFIHEETLDSIQETLNNILTTLNTINETPISDLEKINNNHNSLLDRVNSLPYIFNQNFYNTGNINIPEIRNLILKLREELDLFQDLDIDSILKEANYSELQSILGCILAIHNEYIISHNSNHLPKLVLSAYAILKEVNDKHKKIELNDSIVQLEERTVKMKQSVDLTGNSNLFEAFKNEAKSFNWKIISYNVAILLILTTVLIFLSLLIFIIIFTPDFKFIKDYHFYGFYISFFLFLSILLAYLIKERSRLISHQYYCKITYLELLAMIPFTTQIQDSVKVDDLKIHLAERYFLGPNRMQNNSEPTSSITTSKLSELIKLAQEVKSTIK